MIVTPLKPNNMLSTKYIITDVTDHPSKNPEKAHFKPLLKTLKHKPNLAKKKKKSGIAAS